MNHFPMVFPWFSYSIGTSAPGWQVETAGGHGRFRNRGLQPAVGASCWDEWSPGSDGCWV